MSSQEVFPVEIYSCIISNISPTIVSAVVEHSRAMIAPRTRRSPLVDSQNRSDLLKLSLVSKSWLDICRCIFHSIIFTETPDDDQKRKQFIQLLQHPLCTFRKHIGAFVLQDPPSGSKRSPFAVDFLAACLGLLPETKALSLQDVDFCKCSDEKWKQLSALIFTPEQQALLFLKCGFPAPDSLAANLTRCSKLSSFAISCWDKPVGFGRSSQAMGTGYDQNDATSAPSFGSSLKDLNISALYPAFPGASTMQTINTYLYQVCHTAERLQLANFHCHLALETGEPQDGVDLLATFIDKKIDGSVLQFLNLHLLIFHENGASLEKLGKAVSALSNLEYLMLTIPPVTKQTHERIPYSHAKIFVLMLLESISSSRLRTVFFMVGAIPKVKDLIFLDWAAIGRALLRPNYANLESIMADCTGNLKADEWADKSVPWLNAHVRPHIPSHIAVNVGGIGPAGLVSVNPSRSGSRMSTKVRAFRDALVSFLPF